MKAKLLLVTQVVIVLRFVSGTPCSRVESVDISSGDFQNGTITHNGIEYTNDLWYEVIEDNSTIWLGCPCIGRRCLWKCCGEGQMFLNRSCAATDLEYANPFSPPIYKGQDLTDVAAHTHFFYIHNLLCEERYLVDPQSSNNQAFLQENGTLMEITPSGTQWHSPTMHCVDMMLSNASIPPRMVAAVCYPKASEDDSPYLYIAYAIGLMLSTPFLLATFLVYAFISELRNLHGLCLMAYCAGLIVAYPLLAFLKMSSVAISVEQTGCLILAFVIYYSFQSSFFWLNVMCFDIWRTFSGYRGGSTSKRRERRRFALYGLYAWGMPAVLTAITVGMQFSDDLPPNIILPNFGKRRCWFVDWLSELVYFFIPVLVLVVCNVVLFSVTANRIRSIRQETAILKGAESSRSDKLKRDKQRYALYLKLFMVMGVNWTVEVISFAAGGSNWYWILIDISNIGLGFFIFFIFVWKNKVRTLVRKKFAKWRGATPEGRTTFSGDSNSTGRWATRTSSAPTEVTRVSSDDPGVRLRDLQ